MKVTPQRKKYLADLRNKVMPFWITVVNQYNSGITAKEIAEMHINRKTGNPYSRQHIHSIIKIMSKI